MSPEDFLSRSPNSNPWNHKRVFGPSSVAKLPAVVYHDLRIIWIIFTQMMIDQMIMMLIDDDQAVIHKSRWIEEVCLGTIHT